MAHIVDSRPRFNSYPTAINTQYAPAPSKQYSSYHYAAATPTTTPTKSHPSSSYPYRQASGNPSHSRLASAPTQQASSSSSRAPPTRTASVPTARPSTSSAPVPVHRSTNPLPAAPEAFSHSRKGSVSRPSQSQPPADAYRSAKRDEYSSRQQPESSSARQARLLAEHEATLKRMEVRQRKAEAQAWYEESQRLAADAARRQQDEERRRADEKVRADENLRRAAQAKLDEEQRRLNARKQQERGRSQTHNPAAPSVDGGKWYHGIFGKREKSRDVPRRRDERGSDREQRGERERAKSEARAQDAKSARERSDKDRSRQAMSEGSAASAWVTYEKACAELMDAKPTKGKPLSSNLTFYDIPWPVFGTASSFHDLTTQNIAAFLLSPHHSQGKTRRARLRAAILIWHPDKFAQKVLPRVAESHRPAVVAAVNVVARIVTELISADGN